MKKNIQKGFTLIEVMVALLILSIGLGALLVASAQNIKTYQRLEAHMAENWVSLQNINLLRLGLIQFNDNQAHFSKTKILNQMVYSKLEKKSTNLTFMKQIILSSRVQPKGPFDQIYYSYLYEPSE